MQNRDLTTLTTIAATGSFREAAERLNMTLSAVSMQMKALEATLGGALFDRRSRPPTLTPLGRATVTAAEEVLAAEDRLRRLARPGDGLSGDFRLGLVASAGPRLLPRFLTRAPTALPSARFTFRTGLSEALEQDVASGALDAAVVTATGVPPGGLRHRVLATDRLMLAIPHGLSSDAPFLHFAPSTGIGKLIARALADRPDLSARPRIVLDHVQTIRACLREGVGATILPEVDLLGLAADRETLPDSRDLVMVARADAPLDTHANQLANLLTG